MSEDTAPPKVGELFFCYTADESVEDVAEKFKRRFGYHAARVFRAAGIIWAGPVRDY